MDNNVYNKAHRVNELCEELKSRSHLAQLMFQKMNSNIAYTQLAFGMGYMPVNTRQELMHCYRHISNRCDEEFNELRNDYLRNKIISSAAKALSCNRRDY